MAPVTIKIGDADVDPRDVAGISRGGVGENITHTLVVHTFPVKKVNICVCVSLCRFSSV